MSQEKNLENTSVSPETEQKNDAPETFQSKLPSKKRTALLRYMAVMFIAAFLLVLVSFFTQHGTIRDLNREKTGIVARAEQLQAENRELQADLTTARGYVEEAREAGEANVANTKTAYDALLTVLSTQEPQDGDVEYAKAVETVENMKEYLSDDAAAAFDEAMAAREETDAQ